MTVPLLSAMVGRPVPGSSSALRQQCGRDDSILSSLLVVPPTATLTVAILPGFYAPVRECYSAITRACAYLAAARGIRDEHHDAHRGRWPGIPLAYLRLGLGFGLRLPPFAACFGRRSALTRFCSFSKSSRSR